MTLDQEQDVVDLARRLGLKGAPVKAILDYCSAKVKRWAAGKPVTSIDDLQAVIASQIRLKFEDVNEDADLGELRSRYAKIGEFVFATLKDDLTAETFGTMIRLKDGSHVAVIDCRGSKASRRFFTRWHEIAHLLVDEYVEKQVFRATDDPLERLMDQIAGHIGFFDELFGPLLRIHVPDGTLLTFERIDSLRQAYCAHASFQSTLFACHRLLTTPILYIEAALAHSADEERRLRQNRYVNEPQKNLRVHTVLQNGPAYRLGLTVQRRMRVPDTSTVALAFGNDLMSQSGTENLSTWTFSKGGSLKDRDVFIEARRIDQTVMAIIQPN